jgi:hypothetical protein
MTGYILSPLHENSHNLPLAYDKSNVDDLLNLAYNYCYNCFFAVMKNRNKFPVETVSFTQINMIKIMNSFPNKKIYNLKNVQKIKSELDDIIYKNHIKYLYSNSNPVIAEIIHNIKVCHSYVKISIEELEKVY